jgi:hypothetical protein
MIVNVDAAALAAVDLLRKVLLDRSFPRLCILLPPVVIENVHYSHRHPLLLFRVKSALPKFGSCCCREWVIFASA